jgi:metal-responsive CopG/Arc/MetJ family transcriptional regulator
MNMPRVNKPVNTTIPPDLLAELDAWIAAQPVPPSRSAVIVAALRQFLAGQSAAVQEGDPAPPKSPDKERRYG